MAERLEAAAPAAADEYMQDGTVDLHGNTVDSNALASLPAKAQRVLTATDIENYGATSSVMSTPGSRAMAAGLTVMLISVSAGIHFGAGGFGLLLSFMGVLVSSSLVAAGVRIADGPAPIAPPVFYGAQALAAFVRRNTDAVGLVMVSCAVTMFSCEADPLLCFATFTLLLLGVSLINIGARGP